MSIKKISEESLHNIKRKSAKALPDKPSAQGYTAEEIKNYLTNFVIDDNDSFKAELDRIVDEINEFISGIDNVNLKNYILDAIIAKFTEQNPILSISFNKETKLLEYSKFLNQNTIDLFPDDSVFISDDVLKNKQGYVVHPKTSIDKLIDTIDNKTVREYILNLNSKIETLLSKHDNEISTINENIAAIIGGDAPKALDSIKELAEALNNNPSEVDVILTQIESLKNSKVDKVDGKQLTTNDYSNEDKAFVDSLKTKNLIGEEDLKTDLSQFNDDSEHRLVTDQEKNYWSNKEEKGHKHEINDINRLRDELDSKSSNTHTHACGEIGAEKIGVAAELLREHNLSDESHKDIRNYIENVEKKVDGINQAISFVNERQLIDWIAGIYSRTDGKTVSDLFVGQHIYIEEQDERDFWVKETPVTSLNNLKELVTDKIALEDYSLKEDLAGVATSGSYKDLKDTPEIYYNLSEMTPDPEHRTISDEKLEQIDTNTEKIKEKFDKNLGIDEANKMLITDEEGKVTTAVAGSMSVLVDNLTSSSATMPLSANQGRILNNIKLDKQQGTENAYKYLYVNESGMVDLSKIKNKLSEFENDKNYQTLDQIQAIINAIPTPDVSGQIANHNTDEQSHQDIRDLIPSLSGYATENFVKTEISKIPTPDVSGQISTHNTNSSAHQDIRDLIDSKIADLINGAPTTLDTLKEIADVMSANQSVVSALETSIGKKANSSDLSKYLPLSEGGWVNGQIASYYNGVNGMSYALLGDFGLQLYNADVYNSSRGTYGDTPLTITSTTKGGLIMFGNNSPSFSEHELNFWTNSNYFSRILASSDSIDINRYNSSYVAQNNLSLLINGKEVATIDKIPSLTGYAKTSDLENYLPLSGGTLKGNIDLPKDFHLYDTNGNIILYSAGNASSSLMILGSEDVAMLINNSSKSIIVQTPDGDDYVALRSELSTYLPLSGGTMSGPLVLTGGDAVSGVGNMQLDTNGQITAKGTNSTLFGRTNNGTDLLLGHSSYNTLLRGKQTRPTYNGKDMALYSDLNYNNLTNKPTIPTNNNQLTNGAGYVTSSGSVASATNATKLNNQDASYYLNYNNFTNKPTIPTNTNQLTNGSGFITSAGSMQTLYSGTATSGTITLSQNLVSSSKDLIVFFWINDEDIYQTLAIPESTLYSINSSTYNLAFRSTTASTNKTMTLHRSGANTLVIDSNSSSYTKLKNIYRMHLN